MRESVQCSVFARQEKLSGSPIVTFHHVLCRIRNWIFFHKVLKHNLQTKQNLCVLLERVKTCLNVLIVKDLFLFLTNQNFQFGLKDDRCCCSLVREVCRHSTESATHWENQFQQTHLITAMSSLHFKYVCCKSRMWGSGEARQHKNSKSLPTQSSKASTCFGMGSSHITRLGKRAHLQVLLALMEACKVAATHVTLLIVIGFGWTSLVNKSCHCVLVRESTFTWLHKSVCSYFLCALPKHTCLPF